jgi:hypothetical protein
MLYREDYHDHDSERPGQMDVIVRKNRRPRLGETSPRMDSRLPFLSLERSRLPRRRSLESPQPCHVSRPPELTVAS